MFQNEISENYMKIPKTPPKLSDAFSSSAMNSEKLVRIMSYSSSNPNREYYHWDDFRYRPIPDGIDLTREEIWYGMRMLRQSNSVKLPFLDCKGSVFMLSRPDQILSDLRQIDLRAGGTIDFGNGEANSKLAKQRIKRSLIEEPFSSSVLEGAATTRERAKSMIESNVAPVTRDDRMVFNNYQAMELVKDNIDQELTPELILEIHRVISQDTLDRPEMAGVLRDDDNVDIIDTYGEVLHVPPSHAELSGRLKKICTFANETEHESNYFMHPIIRAILLHFQLAYDHPFVDGNGRTARALFYWSVLRSGYWMFEFISISKVIKSAPIKYGKAFLHSETDDNDTTYFVIHQLKVLLQSIKELETYIEDKKNEFEAFENLLKGHNLNHRQSFLLNELVKQKMPHITIKEHELMQGISHITARKDLEKLIPSGLLNKSIKANKAYYSIRNNAAYGITKK